MINESEVQVSNCKAALKNAVADPAVGIKIANLTKHPSFGMYITEIPPGQKVGAHFHRYGVEIYGILSGSGVIHTAIPSENNIPIHIQSKTVMAGDFFNIEQGVIHQLENTANETLVLIFGCPASHLSEDRVITTDLISK